MKENQNHERKWASSKRQNAAKPQFAECTMSDELSGADEGVAQLETDARSRADAM